MRSIRIGGLLIALASLPFLGPDRVHAAGRPSAQVSFAIPTSNVASAGPILDGRHIVYAVATPRYHRPVCVSCGQRPFSGFHLQVYLRDYQQHPGAIVVSAAWLLFTGPQGAQIRLDALRSGWLVYDTTTPVGAWQLLVRNISTGRTRVLDSSRTEGQGSRLVRASSDGLTVAWQSSTQAYGPRRGIWTFAFATGRRQLLPCGVARSDSYCVFAQVEGRRLVLVREGRSQPSSQILVQNLTTGYVRTLTPAGGMNWEPFLSGNVIAWVHGALTLGHRHGLVIQNLASGRRVALPRSSSQLPRIAEGRYVVFATDYATANPAGAVQVYDTRTGLRSTIVRGPDRYGFIPPRIVEVGGSAALVPEYTPCASPTGACPTRLALIRL